MKKLLETIQVVEMIVPRFVLDTEIANETLAKEEVGAFQRLGLVVISIT